MLNNTQGNTSQFLSTHSAYQIDDSISNNQAENLPLASQIKKLANSNESLASVTAHFYPEEGQVRSSCYQQGWLKHFLIKLSIFAGTAALAAGAFTYFSRREGNGNQLGHISDAELLPQRNMSFLKSPERLSMPGIHDQISSTAADPFNSTEVINNSSEPYQYYKNIYGTKVPFNITETEYNPYGAFFFEGSY